MLKYKLVALDMDGTVLNSKGQISDKNRQAIMDALEAGVTVMFATGRGIQSIMPYVEELQIDSPIVASNGSEVWKKPHDLLSRKLLEIELIRRMHQLAHDRGVWYWAYTMEGLFNRDNWVDDINAMNWLKFGFQDRDLGRIADIREELHSWGTLELSNSHPSNIEVNPAGISKATGISQVCDMVGLTMSDVVAVGDGMNDYAMIRAAGLGVAMGNAQDQLKEVADQVTLTNDEHGVAEVIYKYVL